MFTWIYKWNLRPIKFSDPKNLNSGIFTKKQTFEKIIKSGGQTALVTSIIEMYLNPKT